MTEYATKDEVQDIVTTVVNKAVDDLSEIIGNLAQTMHHELATVKKENHRTRESIDRLSNTIDGFVGRFDRYESEQLARDNQFQRLLDWARKVSEKTGIPLEDLVGKYGAVGTIKAFRDYPQMGDIYQHLDAEGKRHWLPTSSRVYDCANSDVVSSLQHYV